MSAEEDTRKSLLENAKIARDLADSPAARAMRDLADSPAARAMRDLADLPAARAMRDLADSPAARAMRDLADSPAARATRDLAGIANLPTTRDLAGIANLPTARDLAGIANLPTARDLAGIANLPTARDLAGIASLPTARDLAGIANLPTTRDLAGITATMREIQALASTSPLTQLAREIQMSPSLATVARTNQWASQLGVFDHDFLSNRLSINLDAHRQMHRLAAGVLGESSTSERMALSHLLGLQDGHKHAVSGIQTKLSELAGYSAVTGFAAQSSVDAYSRIFGTWHTAPDLPKRFWRDPELRRRFYQEADVDPELIDTTPASAIEVVVSSGFAAGVTEDATSIAFLDIAGVSLSIRSSNPGRDAFSAINTFEEALRRFISAKLHAINGSKWFKQRVDGAKYKKAQENRAAALSNGEKNADLIAYLDLGDLISILIRKDNWDNVFGDVFPNRDQLEFDLRSLVATRRPVMHARSIDAVRLVETMCIIRRLDQLISDDGEWKRLAAIDD